MSEQTAPDGPPRGEEEVTEAILAAAAELLAEREPSQVSLRAIASKAGVNYGLVHRHIGTKSDLVAATVRRHSSRFPVPEGGNDPVGLVVAMARHYLDSPAVARSLAWAAMNGDDVGALVADLHDVTELIRQLGEVLGSEDEAELLFCFAACAVLGVGVLGDVALAASGRDPGTDRRALEAYTVELVGRLVSAEAGASRTGSTLDT